MTNPEMTIPEVALAHILTARLEAMQTTMQRIEGVQKEMAANFSKLIVIEERQTATMAGLERAFKALEKVETKLEAYTAANRETSQALEKENADLAKRVVELEKSEPMQAQTSKWVLAAVWGSLGLLAAFLAQRVLGKMFS